MTFKEQILQGIPSILPNTKPYEIDINHAPKRKEILSEDEKTLALKNALRYFEPQHHAELLPEFKAELETFGRIYMYRFRPDYKMYARPISEYPGKSEQAKAIMLMIQNNLDYAVAQHPNELITYGGNGAVFQNWAQYLLTMKYLAEMTEEQTLSMYSGHPMGLFPSHKDAPRVVVTNGMVIPNYSKPDDWEKMNALGVSQYCRKLYVHWSTRHCSRNYNYSFKWIQKNKKISKRWIIRHFWTWRNEWRTTQSRKYCGLRNGLC
jgi:urocanate hydratase